MNAATPQHCESPGRVLAIDYGTVRLGLAISDARQQIASPLANYNRAGIDRDLEFLRRVVSDEQVTRIVVGLPIHLDGRESQKSLEVRRFSDWLQREIGLPVVLHDERFTSVEAEAALLEADLSRKQRKARRDKLAAQLLLTAYLESDRQTRGKTPGSIDDRPNRRD
jgi:putative Holliday junction resolvase